MNKITLKNTIAHFKKICVYKYWVTKYCFKAGLYWQGITHDLSKFSPTEFWESVRFYQGTSSPINTAKAEQGYSLAWQHHKGRNPHHYEYWTDKYDDGTVALEMPYKYATELICDWLGAARAYLGSEFSYEKELEWWNDKIKNHPPKMHEQTRNFIDIIFHRLYSYELTGKKPEDLFNVYELSYDFKLAAEGNYQHWIDFEEKIKEQAAESASKLGIQIITTSIFL